MDQGDIAQRAREDSECLKLIVAKMPDLHELMFSFSASEYNVNARANGFQLLTEDEWKLMKYTLGRYKL